MAEIDERRKIVETARSFVGTRYHHEGKIKGVGVDCATLIAMTFEEAGVRPLIDIKAYSQQWHLHSEDPLYEKAIEANGGKLVDTPQIGDLALYYQGKQFAHGAIVSQIEPLTLIHAYAPARRVVEGAETQFPKLAGEQKKFYSAW